MHSLRAIVLGSAAGGGFPQWNCRCGVCELAWQGDPRVKARTQSSLAVEGSKGRWALFNASPDLKAQIMATPALQPRPGALRDSPIVDVVLTNADVDHVMGLVHLRERQRFAVHASARTLAALADNPVFRVLDRSLVMFVRIEPEKPFIVAGDVAVTAFVTPGKAPLYLEGEGPQPVEAANDGSAIGLDVRRGDARLVYAPGVAAFTDGFRARAAGAGALLVDGTVFHDDEMRRAGVGSKTGRRMGHAPIAGEGGSLERLAGLGGRRIYVHINNTNPILVAGSPERQAVEADAWEVGEDGMEIVL